MKKLICEECLNSNYNVKNNSNKRIKIKKYCRFCKKHTLHKEDK